MLQPLFSGTSARRAGPYLILWTGLAMSLAAAGAEDPVALRFDSLLVTPAHTPSAVVHVKNLRDAPYQGVVRLNGPQGWALKNDQHEIALSPGETAKLSFMVQRGTAVEENSYPLELIAIGGGATVKHRQKIVTASAPYYKPQVDGDASDWKDAIPINWTVRGKKTTVGTYWNRKQFAVLVAVEEDRLVPMHAETASDPCDAIQIAISAEGSQTAGDVASEAARYEFLFVPTSSAGGRCYLLATPDTKLGQTQAPRELPSLVCEGTEVVVRRDSGTTWYECSLPFKLMRDIIRPGEGREFCLSILVHDPDGTGIRDWGEAAGLWPWQRNRLAWSRWSGAKWGEEPPFDNRIPWGMCSSKY